MTIFPFQRQWSLPLCLLVVCVHIQSISALNIAYCSSQNTGGGAVADSSIYQSNGRCHDQCNPSYAFAIVQGDNCWCSNYIPANQQSTSKCNVPCPGYPSDLCGNEAQGLFGYIALDNKPSGTAGAASSITTSSVQAAATTSPSDSITSIPKSSQSPTPVTNVQVVTQSGVIVTQTVTTMPSIPASSLSGTQRKSNGIAPGYIAAAVIAGLFGLGFIGGALFLYWRRRTGRKDSEIKGASSRDMQRNISVHSKAGLLDNRMYAPTIDTRISSHALDMGSSDGTTPVSPMSERRKSQPLMYDQRLNPNALMANDNGSHTSLRTLDDHRDYGRMLKVTNPDAVPERPSFS